MRNRQRKTPVPAAPVMIPTREVELPRVAVFSLLFAAFTLAFLLVPYCSLLPPGSQAYLVAAAMLVAGLAWAYLCSGRLTVQPARRWWAWLAAAIALVAAINVRTMAADLPWRGDEDHHIKTTQMLLGIAHSHWHLVAMAAGPAALTLAFRRACLKHDRLLTWLALPVLGLLAAVIMLQTPSAERTAAGLPPWNINIARYPLLVHWLASGPAAIVGLFTAWLPEWSYRIVPLLSTALIGWYGSQRIGELRLGGRVLYIVFVATVPTVFYYTSILYMEMPPLALITIVCLGAEDLLTASPKELVRRPGWYALLLAGFLKETTIMFLAAFVLARVVSRLLMLLSPIETIRQELRQARTAGRLTRYFLASPRVNSIVLEAVLAVGVVLPYVTFWSFRPFCQDMFRAFEPGMGWLSDPATYPTLLLAFWQQYGLLALALPVALVLLWRQKRRHMALFLLLTFLMYLGLHLVDAKYPILGYSRYMLVFAPVLLAGAHELIAAGARRAWPVTIAALVAVVAVQLLITPVRPDGARQSGWGEYRYKYSERFYPYRQAFAYILQNYPNDGTLVTGFDYPYWHQFYVGDRPNIRRMPYTGPDESVALEELLAKVRQAGGQHVLWHVLRASLPHPAQTSGFVAEKVFENSEHSLVLYSLPRRVMPK